MKDKKKNEGAFRHGEGPGIPVAGAIRHGDTSHRLGVSHSGAQGGVSMYADKTHASSAVMGRVNKGHNPEELEGILKWPWQEEEPDEWEEDYSLPNTSKIPTIYSTMFNENERDLKMTNYSLKETLLKEGLIGNVILSALGAIPVVGDLLALGMYKWDESQHEDAVEKLYESFDRAGISRAEVEAGMKTGSEHRFVVFLTRVSMLPSSDRNRLHNDLNEVLIQLKDMFVDLVSASELLMLVGPAAPFAAASQAITGPTAMALSITPQSALGALSRSTSSYLGSNEVDMNAHEFGEELSARWSDVESGWANAADQSPEMSGTADASDMYEYMRDRIEQEMATESGESFFGNPFSTFGMRGEFGPREYFSRIGALDEALVNPESFAELQSQMHLSGYDDAPEGSTPGSHLARSSSGEEVELTPEDLDSIADEILGMITASRMGLQRVQASPLMDFLKEAIESMSLHDIYPAQFKSSISNLYSDELQIDDSDPDSPADEYTVAIDLPLGAHLAHHKTENISENFSRIVESAIEKSKKDTDILMGDEDHEDKDEEVDEVSLAGGIAGYTGPLGALPDVPGAQYPRKTPAEAAGSGFGGAKPYKK